MLHRDVERIVSQPAYRVSPAGENGAGLIAIARIIADAQPLWSGLVRHDPQQRGFVRVLDTPDVEAWVLTWSGEQTVELHDHGGSRGAVLVVDGELIEAHTDLRSRRPLQRSRWRAGITHVFDGNHVHDLQNFAGGQATSVHVYSPPLRSMTFYEQRPSAYLEPIRVEPVAAPTH